MTDIIPIFPTLLIRHNTKPEFDSIKKSFVEYTYHEMSENDDKSNKGWQSATIHKEIILKGMLKNSLKPSDILILNF